jgi:cytochrome c oxidase subunit 2
VRVELSSADVIHSFWVPQLAGKMDVIPGQTNVSWLEADSPGSYRGQCAAFCGAQHAHMALLVVAESAAAFAAWQDRQLAEAAPPPSGNATLGEHVFETHCAPCHTVRGVTPAGIRGPDLSHLMTRRTIAAALLPNKPGNLAAWIANPQSFKPGARMPAQILSGAQLAAVTSYLNTLD